MLEKVPQIFCFLLKPCRRSLFELRSCAPTHKEEVFVFESVSLTISAATPIVACSFILGTAFCYKLLPLCNIDAAKAVQCYSKLNSYLYLHRILIFYLRPASVKNNNTRGVCRKVCSGVRPVFLFCVEFLYLHGS